MNRYLAQALLAAHASVTKHESNLRTLERLNSTYRLTLDTKGLTTAREEITDALRTLEHDMDTHATAAGCPLAESTLTFFRHAVHKN